MVNTQEKNRMQKLSEGLSKILAANWKIIIVFIGASILVIAGLSIGLNLKGKKIAASAEVLDELETLYEDKWVSAQNDDKAEVKEELFGLIDVIKNEYPETYASQKSLIIAGNVSYAQEEWDLAAEYYAELADTFSESFLAPMALMYAAAATEEAGDNSGALSFYQRIIDNYSDSLEIMRAQFNLGRLSEKNGDVAAAITFYNEIIDENSQDPWAMLAQSRLLYLSK